MGNQKFSLVLRRHDNTYSGQKNALHPFFPIFFRATKHVNIVRCILKEAEIIGGLHSEDIRLRGLVYPCDHVCVEVGQRAEECFVFSLRKEVIHLITHMIQKTRYSHCPSWRAKVLALATRAIFWTTSAVCSPTQHRY